MYYKNFEKKMLAPYAIKLQLPFCCIKCLKPLASSKTKEAAMQDEKTFEEEQIKASLILLVQSCHSKNWILKTNGTEDIKDLICLICRQIVNNLMELTCHQHESVDDILIVEGKLFERFSYNKILQKFLGNVPVTCHSSNMICSGSMDNTIRFWDVRLNKKELYALKGYNKKDNGIYCLTFLPLNNNFGFNL
ncbi:hypothetical protein RFI_32766 [Reticulomyxa filosa]|uniref:Uncharacterized protein n=1 Tax=Reticulomyxa filosa TaxID=46433 RepID=X6LSK6_RETFI|nr:hypothetical protein RFI_32766 [Reticulomyxa filosa]|eukprot:ETO04629.1 hypothetical protein RFI_32766 [Reticulomyxa filosa]